MSGKLIFERSKLGLTAVRLPACDVDEQPIDSLLPASLRRAEPAPLPEVGELTLVRHYTELSKKNISVDDSFYPLGSCTMKYNPKINETYCALPGLRDVHPYQAEASAQGTLQILHRLQELLAEISGLDAVTLQPAAGAHGELTALMMVAAYHRDRGEARDTVLIPDSAHGTNPASSTFAGLRCEQVKSCKRGVVDVDDLRAKVNDRTAAMMITNPNTLGLFEDHVARIARVLHEAGALLYLDGANMNAIAGMTKPSLFGVDVMHFNLHKTFSTPHGGGGPGSGPVAAGRTLAPYLPVPLAARRADGGYFLDFDRPRSIGKVKAFWGNVGMAIRAYIYLRTLGAAGIRRMAENAVLNANYVMARLRGRYTVAYDRTCMHEFVLNGTPQKKKGARALDIAKRLLDYDIHPPTIYFPLIVPEAMMIEPTETESKETLDAFVDAMLSIADEIDKDPQILLGAPYNRAVRRLDEVRATREPVIRWQPARIE